jgi:spore maturation protein CgeB
MVTTCRILDNSIKIYGKRNSLPYITGRYVSSGQLRSGWRICGFSVPCSTEEVDGRWVVKITIFGLTLSSSWGNGHATPYRAVLRALARHGHRVTFFEKDTEYYALRRDFNSCGYCDLVIYGEWEDIRRRATQEAADSDVVVTASFCPEGARINDAVLALERPLRVFYDLDTPVTLAKLRSGDLDYLRARQIPEFDLVLSWSGGRSLVELETVWKAALARPLFGCVDPDIYAGAPREARFESVLSYMGTYAADRQDKLDRLFLECARRRPDLAFLLAGTLYPWHWEWPANVKRFDHVSPSEHPALYSSSRLTLNLTRAEMAACGYCPSGRFFEAAACGTPILSDWFEGLDTFFRPGEEVLIAASAEDAVQALDLGDGDLARISARARQRTLDEHTGEHRARQMLDYFEEAFTARHRKPAALLRQPHSSLQKPYQQERLRASATRAFTRSGVEEATS